MMAIMIRLTANGRLKSSKTTTHDAHDLLHGITKRNQSGIGRLSITLEVDVYGKGLNADGTCKEHWKRHARRTLQLS